MGKVQLWLLAVLAFLLASLASGQGFSRGYDIDDAGDFGKECQIVSGSVTSKFNRKLLQQSL